VSYDTHAEGNGEYPLPEVEEGQIDEVVSLQPKRLEDRKVACKPNGESGENDVDTDGKSKLQTRQFNSFQT
jgi:hypothetical protein